MLTGLDLLIIVVMALAAASLLAMLLMFLVKNRIVRKICFYFVVTLGIYLGYVGLRILWFGFPGQAAVAVLMALTAVGALVMELVSKGNKKLFLAARLMAVGSVIIGLLNAFLI